jgi:UDP-N-acetyl-D-galactosamine dehydrogenase
LEANVLMLGITFKENCPDIRNTRAIDIYHELTTFNMHVDIYDPWASEEEVRHEFGVSLVSELKSNTYSAVILAVAHAEFNYTQIEQCKTLDGVVYDVKGILPKDKVDNRL